MKGPLRFAPLLACTSFIAMASSGCNKKSSEPTVEQQPVSHPVAIEETNRSEHYQGGETVTETGRLEGISSTPVAGSEFEAVVLSVSTDGTTGKRISCKLTLGATAPNLAIGSSISISGKVDPQDTNSLEDCAMLAQ